MKSYEMKGRPEVPNSFALVAFRPLSGEKSGYRVSSDVVESNTSHVPDAWELHGRIAQQTPPPPDTPAGWDQRGLRGRSVLRGHAGRPQGLEAPNPAGGVRCGVLF